MILCNTGIALQFCKGNSFPMEAVVTVKIGIGRILIKRAEICTNSPGKDKMIEAELQLLVLEFQ